MQAYKMDFCDKINHNMIVGADKKIHWRIYVG